MAKRNDYHRDGPSAEDRALERFTELMIEKISTLKKDWSKPWFTEGMMKWPKNLSGREYNGMNALMLALECEKRGYELPVFCTFDAALSLNYSKKKDGSRQPLVDENGENLPHLGRRSMQGKNWWLNWAVRCWPRGMAWQNR